MTLVLEILTLKCRAFTLREPLVAEPTSLELARSALPRRARLATPRSGSIPPGFRGLPPACRRACHLMTFYEYHYHYGHDYLSSNNIKSNI